MADSFESHDLAEIYAKHRPAFPELALKRILSYCDEGGMTRGLAVDLGCGSGQSSYPLSLHFKHVIGVDINKVQIDKAQRRHNLEYVVGRAEDLGFVQDGSVDLVLVSTALHWMDKAKVYLAVKRVLKPNGVFAVMSYSPGYFPESEEATSYHLKIQFDDLKEYIHPAALESINGYPNIKLPFSDVKRYDTEMSMWFTEQAFMGFITSLSTFQRYLKQNPTGTFHIEAGKRIGKILQSEAIGRHCFHDDGIEYEYIIPVFMFLSRINSLESGH